jgi:hypothetical protein
MVGSDAETVASVNDANEDVNPVSAEPSPSLIRTVPVESGNVIVLSEFVLGAVSVTVPVPDALPCIFTFAIS